jgi:hypothetical protein
MLNPRTFFWLAMFWFLIVSLVVWAWFESQDSAYAAGALVGFVLGTSSERADAHVDNWNQTAKVTKHLMFCPRIGEYIIVDDTTHVVTGVIHVSGGLPELTVMDAHVHGLRTSKKGRPGK